MSIDYRQPSFYRFNQDSILLVKYIESLKLGPQLNFIDIGSGCGIIGIELARLNESWTGTLLEPQEEFIEYLNFNKKLFKVNHLKVVTSKIESLNTIEKFKLIVFNPPYFFEGQGRAGENELRQKCRQIKESDFLNWFKVSSQLLANDGRIIFCFRRNERWQRNFKPKGLNYYDLYEGESVDFHCLGK